MHFAQRQRRNAWLAAMGLAVALSVSSPACRRSPPPPPAKPSALPIEFAGCAAVRAGPRCELGPSRELRLVLSTPPQSGISVRVDDVPLPVAPVEVEGGTSLRLTVPEAARTLRVRAKVNGAMAEGTLQLATRVEHPGLAAAEALRHKGKLEEASQQLDTLVQAPQDELRAQALRKLARIARARGNTSQAVRQLEQAIAIERARGMISEEVEDRLVLSFTHLYGARQLAQARHVLEGLAGLESLHPEGAVFAAYYRALLAYEAGDLRAALRLFRTSERGARRLRMDAHRLDVLPQLAEVLALLGRYDDAVAVAEEAERLAPRDMDACRKGSLLTNLCWIELRAPAASRGASKCDRQLAEALELFREACPHPQDRANVLTNLAIHAFDQGRPADAERYVKLARSASVSADPRLEVWWMGLEGKIGTANGQHQLALARFDRLAAIAHSALLFEARLEAELGRANALWALQRFSQAHAAFRKASESVEEWSLFVPLGEGRETFLARHESITQQHVQFLMARAERRGASKTEADEALREAVHVVRAARARLVRLLRRIDLLDGLSADQRVKWEKAAVAYRAERDAQTAKAAEDWRLPSNELARAATLRRQDQDRVRNALDEALSALGSAPGTAAMLDTTSPPQPADGELWLVYARQPHEWIGFGVSRAGVEARHLGEVDLSGTAATLAEQLLRPFEAALTGAKRLRVSAPGRVQSVDVHALPWNGAPLVAHRVVEYGLDVPARPVREAVGTRAALFVGDPRGDLASARDEVLRTKQSLADRGWGATLLMGARADHHAVRAALEQQGLTLLHYAGHGSFQGRDGWESGFPLAGESWLTVQDILALQRVPPAVVLSGCDTARTGTLADSVGLGLAQALVAVGAVAVVAAVRPVEDGLAGALTARITVRLADDEHLDVPQALQRAQRELWETRPLDDWAAFRALVP